jgi:ubiquitin conjugation factor E4 B
MFIWLILYYLFLSILQTLVLKVIHDMLVNSASREPTLKYLAHLLKHNEKRAQILGDERALAGDGFMLNLLSVMHLLAR